MTTVQIDEALVQRLIAAQFPRWAGHVIAPVKAEGHDNRTFHLGDDMSVRLPTAKRYAGQPRKEQRWLPHLAKHVDLQISEPVGSGRPSADYPFDGSVMRWLPGVTLHSARIDRLQLAQDLAGFLNSLRAAPTEDAPVAGSHNFYRGGDLRIYDQELRHSLQQLGDRVDAPAVMRHWARACHSDWRAQPVWIHGDVAVGNLLCADGRLSAVIDFGNCGIGDPACDLAIAWTLFDRPARQVFRDQIALDEGTWDRAKGWALWKVLLEICNGRFATTETLEAILSDHG